MLDPHEPDATTLETNEQPPAQPAPRRRRAASRPAGPPSSAPDAPSIESAREAPEPVTEHSMDAEVAPPTVKAAKKSTLKRTTKKDSEESPPGAGEVVKAPRKRTLKKAVVMATETPSEVAATPSAEPEEVAPAPDEGLPTADMVADGAPEEKLEAPAAEAPAAEEPAAEEPALEPSAAEQEGMSQAAEEAAPEGGSEPCDPGRQAALAGSTTP